MWIPSRYSIWRAPWLMRFTGLVGQQQRFKIISGRFWFVFMVKALNSSLTGMKKFKLLSACQGTAVVLDCLHGLIRAGLRSSFMPGYVFSCVLFLTLAFLANFEAVWMKNLGILWNFWKLTSIIWKSLFRKDSISGCQLFGIFGEKKKNQKKW